MREHLLCEKKATQKISLSTVHSTTHIKAISLLPYRGKFLRKKTCKFWGFVAIWESFLRRFWGMCGFHWQHKWTFVKVFSTKIANLQKFSLLKVFRYTVYICTHAIYGCLTRHGSYLNGCVNVLFKQYTLYMYLLIHKLEPVDISPSISISVSVLVKGMGTRGVHMCTVGLALTVL